MAGSGAQMAERALARRVEVGAASLTQGAKAVAAPAPRVLTNVEKAAVIVRLMLAEGADLPLATLPEAQQTRLAEQMAQMGIVDRDTLAAVVDDFLDALESTGLTFSGGLAAALKVVEGHISESVASRLRRRAGAAVRGDPWERVAALPAAEVEKLLADEAAETAAVALSRLPVPRAAEVLALMPGARARRVALAMARTGATAPDTLRRIGIALVEALDAQPVRAFVTGPVARMGAILNVTPGQTRDEVLEGLEAEDRAFAEEVRKTIFTFAHIPDRVEARDLPRVLRAVGPMQMTTAFAAALGDGALAPVAERILAALSPRMVQQIRDEVAERGKVGAKDADAAFVALVTAIREMEAAGEIVLLEPPLEDGAGA